MHDSLGVVPFIPLLRRFSRIMTGSQLQGDTYVAVLLESIIADPEPLKSAQDVRCTLYELFCKLWTSVPINGSTALNLSGGDVALDMPQDTRSPLSREAYLLNVLEGFSHAQVAQILGCDVASAEKLIEEAANAAIFQRSAHVLIIEDEPLIAMDLEDILTGLGHIPVGTARTLKQALELASSKQPELILADIMLADGTLGTEAVRHLQRFSDVPAIYITAYPERLLTGEGAEPTFLISKPYAAETVKAVIGQALQFTVRTSVAA
jgi:CheY-like chemotaxis protein